MTIPDVHDVKDLAVGQYHVCALTNAGDVICWGSNAHGALGQGTIDPIPGPAVVPSLHGVEAITAGAGHTCARIKSAVWCWGEGAYGRLGDGGGKDRPTPAAIAGVDAEAVFATDSGTCVRVSGGELRCTDPNAKPGAPFFRALPWKDIVALSPRLADCGITTGRRVVCWGGVAKGRRGDNTSDDRSTAAPVAGVEKATRIAAGDEHAFALLENGTLAGWGSNRYGSLAIRNRDSYFTPAPAAEKLTTISDITAGSDHSCAIDSTGAWCWGPIEDGRLGDGGALSPSVHNAAIRPSSGPLHVVDLKAPRRVFAGRNYSCAIAADRTVRCWGMNQYGQLGNGDHANHERPQTVPSLGNVETLAVGAFHVCALLRDGSLRCWGEGDFGAIGAGAPAVARVPRRPAGFAPAKGIALGWRTTCVLLKTGEVECIGINSQGQLGDGTTTDRAKPERVAGVTNAVALASGDATTCALLADGHVICWGGNTHGELGVGDVAVHGSPVTVQGVDTAEEIAVGRGFACARLRDGHVTCWGRNEGGQLGDGKMPLPDERGDVTLPD